MSSTRHAVLSGMRDILPITVGVAPFGLITGAATASVGISGLTAIAMSVVVFAGTAQLAAVDLIGKNAPVLVIVATALIVNLRFVMYSASLAPHFGCLPFRWKGPLAYLLTDQAYAVSISRFGTDVRDRHRKWFYLGAAVTMWLVYQSAFALGVLLGTGVPAQWSLDFAVPLTLLALLPASMVGRASSVTVLVTAVASVLAAGLPLNLGIIAAVIAGVAAGTLLERRASP